MRSNAAFSRQITDDGHELHVGGQGHFPQRQLRRKRPPNAVNGGALLPVLVVRIPTSANMLNTCTVLSTHHLPHCHLPRRRSRRLHPLASAAVAASAAAASTAAAFLATASLAAASIAAASALAAATCSGARGELLGRRSPAHGW
eukprot:scaffold37355_cov78-Phaeocystis_antarctica.AAC.1